MTEPCRILSLDGGGVHVIAQAVLLTRIFAKYPDFFSQIDVFAGTSAGALLALSLAQKGENGLLTFTPETVATMFKRNYSLKYIPSAGIVGAKYSNAALLDLVEKEFGDLAITQMERQVLVPAFRLSGPPEPLQKTPGNWHGQCFTNIKGGECDTPVKDVALRTTAAPTYFPIYQNYIDGGVSCNSPAALTLSECKNRGYGLSGMRILSLSGGTQQEYISSENGNWGAMEWMSSIVDVLLGGNVYISDLMCKELLNDNYCRFELPLSTDVPLDGTDQLATLIEAAEKADLEPIYQWIESNWE